MFDPAEIFRHGQLSAAGLQELAAAAAAASIDFGSDVYGFAGPGGTALAGVPPDAPPAPLTTSYLDGSASVSPTTALRFDPTFFQLVAGPAGVQQVSFIPEAPFTLAIKDEAGATIDPACVAIQMDARGILTATQGAGPNAHTDTFSVADASLAQAGVVNTLDNQKFAGFKIFRDSIAVASQSVGAPAPTVWFYEADFVTQLAELTARIDSSSWVAFCPSINPTVAPSVVLTCDTHTFQVQLILEYSTIGGLPAGCYALKDNLSGTLYSGLTATVSYTKPGGQTGTLTFTGGILTGST